MKQRYVIIPLLAVLVATLFYGIRPSYAVYQVTLNKDTNFSNPAYWYLGCPRHNDAPSACQIKFDTYNTLIYFKCVDYEGSDWSDTVAFQGKPIHGSRNGNYYKANAESLNANPVIYRTWQGGTNYKLEIYVTMRFQNKPTVNTQYSHNSFVSMYPHVAGAFVLIYFEFYYETWSGTYAWSNLANPDGWGVADCAIFEMSQRWVGYYSGGTYYWGQAGSTDWKMNFQTCKTIHDTDLHDIRCGWTFTYDQILNKGWASFYQPVHLRINDFWSFADWYCSAFPQFGIKKIHALRPVTIAVTAETYRATYDIQFCDLRVVYTKY